MVEWIMVFWLETPLNYTEYARYRTERECRDSEQVWQRRLNMVKSKLIAECRGRRND